jgi:hypothetical protein
LKKKVSRPSAPQQPKKDPGRMPHTHLPVVPIRRPVSLLALLLTASSSLYIHTHAPSTQHATVACAFLAHFSHDCSSRPTQRSAGYR